MRVGSKGPPRDGPAAFSADELLEFVADGRARAPDPAFKARLRQVLWEIARSLTPRWGLRRDNRGEPPV